MNRRSFLASLGLVAGSAFAHELDLERLLWTPGQKTIFIPETTITTAATIREALQDGLVAEFPGGWRYEVRITDRPGQPQPLNVVFQTYVRDIEAAGGRIIGRREYRPVSVGGDQSWG